MATRRRRLTAREVDETALDIDVDELDLHVIADVEALEASHQPPLDGGPHDADPRAFRGRSGHERFEPLADSRHEQQRGGGLPDLPLDLRRVVLLLGAVPREGVELTVAVRGRPAGRPAIADLSSRCVMRSGKRRLGAVECV